MNKKIKRVYADEEHPVIVCMTCGRATNKIQIRGGADGSLFPSRLNGKPKTWKRTIKHHKYIKSTWRGREISERMIYFSYFMLPCIEKHHKLSVRKKTFSSKLVKELV